MKLCEFKQSPIHGNGIFAIEDIQKHTELFETHLLDEPLWINIKPNCSYNHSKDNENCSSVTKNVPHIVDGNELPAKRIKFLVALSDIKKGEELFVDYTKDRDLEQPHQGWKP
tara:strand:+ start:1583 stop:1921 length:339 start_codon:yes stop_codon:yes gene_type:complete